MPELKVGDKVYLKPINSRYITNNNILEHIKECEIKKIGRKYFEVWEKNKEWTTLRFRVEDFQQVSHYSIDWELYFNKQEIIDEIEHLNLANEIRNAIGNRGITKLSLEQLRKIKSIIDEGKIHRKVINKEIRED